MRRISISLGIVLLSSLVSWGFSVVKGTGPPDTHGWCPADWLLGCSSGTAALSHQGLFLKNLSVPPRAAYELELKLLPYKSLLFAFEGAGVGNIVIYIDGVPLARIAVGNGEWWIRLDDLPEEGLLRLELDEYCEALLLESVYFPCRGEVLSPPDCLDQFWQGVLIGTGITLGLLLLAYICMDLGE